MKIRAFLLALISLALSSCTTFHGVTPIYPKAAAFTNIFPEVDSLQPTLIWEPVSEIDVTYDVVIYKAIITSAGQRMVGELVDYRERLSQSEYTPTPPLKLDTEYYWSVRVRKGDKVSNWSRYDYEAFFGIGHAWGANLPFRFKTPKGK
jgi:hypothetical protein